jgi:hypothetical protein
MAQQDYSVAGNLRVVGSSTVFGDTTISGQLAIGNSALNLATFATDMIGNVNAANAAIVSANSSMKTYVDTGIGSALFVAGSYGNTVVTAYLPIDPSIVNINSAIGSTNANVSTVRSNVAAANLNIASIQSNITAANANISATYSNVRLLQSNVEYIRANVLANGAVLASNIFVGEGNIQLGNINASGNIVLTGIDDTTIRFVRSPDTTVTAGEVYGNIDWTGEDASTASAGTRARISTRAVNALGGVAVTIQTTGEFSSTALVERFRANSSGVWADSIGCGQITSPSLPTNYPQVLFFTPFMNDSTSANIVNLSISSQLNSIGTPGFLDVIIGHRFRQDYSGFAGGDRANISLTSYNPILGSQPLAYTDTQQSDVEFHVQGVYIENPAVSPPVVKRLRKRWIATISYSTSTGNWTVLDQVLRETAYNSDVTNWPAGAVNASRVFLQANVTAGSKDLVLRLDAPTGAAVTSQIYWQITTRIRTLEYGF